MTSTYLKAIVLIVLLTLFNACEEETMPSSSCDFFVELDADKYENGATSFYQIISAKINDDCLEIKYSSSGCSGESWIEEMTDSEAILESFPIQRNLKMLLENNEACAAVFTKTVSFDLTPIQTESYSKITLNIYGLENPLLYEYGIDSGIDTQIQNKWDLININGGLMGMDQDFPEGSITWEFDENNLTVVNNNPLMGPMHDGFPTGTYSYSVSELNGFDQLHVDDQDLGVVFVKNDELIVDHRPVDGFQYKLRLHSK